jgi:hypothetical protein
MDDPVAAEAMRDPCVHARWACWAEASEKASPRLTVCPLGVRVRSLSTLRPTQRREHDLGLLLRGELPVLPRLAQRVSPARWAAHPLRHPGQRAGFAGTPPPTEMTSENCQRLSGVHATRDFAARRKCDVCSLMQVVGELQLRRASSRRSDGHGATAWLRRWLTTVAPMSARKPGPTAERCVSLSSLSFAGINFPRSPSVRRACGAFLLAQTAVIVS